MVFDEIDTGIGGRIAEAVGRKLARIAGQGSGVGGRGSKGRSLIPDPRSLTDRKQVICITHLPQIARFAETHFLVTKSVHAGRTATGLVRLSPDERVGEIARMLAGAQVTNAARIHAQELLTETANEPE
jgi:DNA repair protein RecN (Recombination protein N)